MTRASATEEKHRVFLAFPVNAAASGEARIATAQERLKMMGFKGKWSTPSQVHLTLLFLGDRDSGELRTINRISQDVAARHSPFSLSSSAIGAFSKRPRLLFLELHTAPEEAFKELAEDLRSSLGKEIYLEPRVLKQQPHAHATLVRFRRPSDSQPLKSMQAEKDSGSPSWRWPDLSDAVPDLRLECSDFRLYQSTLTPRGAIYNELARFPIGAED